MDINTYNLRLQEIDRKIKDNPTNCTDMGEIVVLNKLDGAGDIVIFEGTYNDAQRFAAKTKTDPTNPYYGESGYTKFPFRGTCLQKRYAKRNTLIKEMEAEQQYLKDQYILQQQQATEQARKATEFAQEQIYKAQQEVEQAKNKSEQEKQIAEQQLAKAKTQMAIAKQSEAGNLEVMRIGSGINTINKYKTPLIITSVTIGVLALVFIGYKVLKKAKKV